jgi:hypothetical protein
VIKLTLAVALLALLLGAYGAGMATIRLLHGDGPQGVCAVINPYALGTDGGGPYSAVIDIKPAVRRDGVVTCETGTFISVVPR